MKKKSKIISIFLFLLILIIGTIYIYNLLQPPRTKAQRTAFFLRKVNSIKPDMMRVYTTPIVFYGKVLDQTGNPVSKATVEGSLHTFNPTNPIAYFTTVKPFKLATDDKGFFVYTGKGKCISIRNLQKKGYEELWTEELKRKFYYAREKNVSSSYIKIHTPDKSTPIIFRMRKKEKAEPLIGWWNHDVTYSALTGSLPYSMSMFSNKVFKEKMKLAEFYFESYYPDKGNKQCVALKVTAATGVGIQECGKNDYIAPKEGYKKEYILTSKIVKKKDKHGAYEVMQNLDRDGKLLEELQGEDSFDKYAFVSLQNGKYFGRIKMNIYPISKNHSGKNEYRVYMNTFVNPQEGHRSLEFDKRLCSNFARSGGYYQAIEKFPLYLYIMADYCSDIERVLKEKLPKKYEEVHLWDIFKDKYGESWGNY